MSRTGALYRVKDPDLARAAAFFVGKGVVRVHQFVPHGRSYAVIGLRTQVVLHTWPEHGLVSLDLYPAQDLLAFEEEIGWLRA